MRKTLLVTLAGATFLSAGMLDSRAGAMPLAPPSALGVAAANSSLVQKTTNVCGSNGCVRVQTQRVQHRRPHHP
jgi:hypothetical protein